MQAAHPEMRQHRPGLLQELVKCAARLLVKAITDLGRVPDRGAPRITMCNPVRAG
jgi:hypothetical protein